MHAVNGAAAPGAALDVVDVREQSPLDRYLESTTKTASRIAEELAELRDSESALEVELTRQANEARARKDTYQRALNALTKGSAAPARAPAQAPRPRSSGVRISRKADWQVTDEKVEEVRQRMIALLPTSPHKAGNGDPAITAGFVADNTDGLSPEAAKKALTVLREREQIRVAGTGKGGGVLFALMPDPADGD